MRSFKILTVLFAVLLSAAVISAENPEPFNGVIRQMKVSKESIGDSIDIKQFIPIDRGQLKQFDFTKMFYVWVKFASDDGKFNFSIDLVGVPNLDKTYMVSSYRIPAKWKLAKTSFYQVNDNSVVHNYNWVNVGDNNANNIKRDPMAYGDPHDRQKERGYQYVLYAKK